MPARLSATPERAAMPHRRADHVRNRAAIIAAAQAVLAEQGPDASVAAIVERAGFAKGTFFRHFATKEALFQAVLLTRIRMLGEIARDISAHQPAGWATVSLIMERFLEHLADDRSLGELMERGQIGVTPEMLEARDDLGRVMESAIAAAQLKGEVRPDVSATDFPPIIMMITRSTSRRFATHPRLGLRYLRLFLDGIRVGNETDLGSPPLAVTEL